MGLGVFVVTWGWNRIACHQAWNDGFRGLYLMCFWGPDRGKGLVVSSNGDNAAVPFNCEVWLKIMRLEGWSGLIENTSGGVSSNGGDIATVIPQEEIVNRGIKDLLFSYFEETLPDQNRPALMDSREIEPFAKHNYCAKWKLVGRCSDQQFSRVSNLFST